MLQVLTFSEAGGHPVNEDASAAHPHPADPDCWIICLADGQGGRAGGARAAQLACETAVALASGRTSDELADAFTWLALLADADSAVAADPAAGLTTLIGLRASPDRVVGASCGDSAAVAVSPAGHTILTSRQFKNPPAGSGDATFVPFDTDLARPWRLLVMSDGVWKYAGWDRIAAAAKASGGLALMAALQGAARLPGTGDFQDDFTLVVIEAG